MRNTLGIATVAAVLACGGAAAAPMTKDDYKAGKARIAAQYQAERQKCGAHLGDAAALCVAKARGAKSVAAAELEAAYKPGPRANDNAAVARAQAAYAIAKQECKAQRGEARESCERKAKSDRERARADAAAAKASNAEQAPLAGPPIAPR